MIYTRNKEGFKTKTVKTIMGQGSSSSRPHTLSENGLNLVEQLRQRLQNNNKKTQIGTQRDDLTQNRQKGNRPKSNTPKKLTISKNFDRQDARVDRQQQYDSQNGLKSETLAQKFTQVKQNTFQASTSSNPFSKIKKDTFFQLVNHANKSNQSIVSQPNQLSMLGKNYESTEPLSEINPTEEYQSLSIPKGNIKNSEHQNSLKIEQYNQTKTLAYESPIQGLDKSGYSNPEQEKEMDVMNSSKKVYEEQVKKWKIRANQNSESLSMMNSESYGKADHYNSLNSKSYPNQNILHTKTTPLKLVSKTLHQTIFSLKPSSKPSAISTAQQQYVQLLQTQVSNLKQQLSKNSQKISQLAFSEEKLLVENGILRGDVKELGKRLQLSEKRLGEVGEERFVGEKYERLFEKMRNLLIVGAMELIETKNFIELQFMSSVSNSLASSPQVTHKQPNPHKPTQSILQPLDCQQRIQSINQCLAKVEQTIEVSQKVVSVNHERKGRENQTQRATFGGQVQVRELEETITYKDKIINRLKEEILEMKGSQKSIGLKQSKQSRHTKITQSMKPYSYVDQIHLLRHQITRLTEQNCAFYEKYTRIKAELSAKQNSHQSNSFPNQQQIVQIQTLIGKLDKHNLDKLNNSKLEYWTSAKPTATKRLHTPQTKKTQTVNSKSKPKTVLTLLEKPKALDFIAKPSFGGSGTDLLPGQEKITRRSHEKYSSQSKDQKIEYSREEFSQLVKEFKSSLSGLTPEKRAQRKDRNPQSNDLNQTENIKQSQNIETIELPTFRTPKQNRDDHQQSDLLSKPPVEFYSQQQQQSNQTGYLQAISRLEYQKEFLASERENLLKENEKLLERIKELEGSEGSERLNGMEEEVYRLRFQNQELVDRVVEVENLLGEQGKEKQSYQSQNAEEHLLSQSLHSKQLQIQHLMQQNISLHKTIHSLQAKHQQLTKTLQTLSPQPSPQDPISYTLVPSFESLVEFLKKLPQQKQQYHKILLKMIEGYERKVSQLREEGVWGKTRQKELEDVLGNCGDLLERVGRYLLGQKLANTDQSSTQFLTKLQQQVHKTLSLITQLSSSCLSQSLSPFPSPHSSHPSLISSLQSKINYYLMLLRSFIQGIGESDLELIESELSDYLKQLKCRIPTVLEREEFEESCVSSLNASIVQDEEGYEGEE